MQNLLYLDKYSRVEQIYSGACFLDSVLAIIYYSYEYHFENEEVKNNQLIIQYITLIIIIIFAFFQFALTKLKTNKFIKSNIVALNHLITLNFLAQILLYINSLVNNEYYNTLNCSIKIFIAVSLLKSIHNLSPKTMSLIILLIIIYAQFQVYETSLIPRIQICVIMIIPFYYYFIQKQYCDSNEEHYSNHKFNNKININDSAIIKLDNTAKQEDIQLNNILQNDQLQNSNDLKNEIKKETPKVNNSPYRIVKQKFRPHKQSSDPNNNQLNIKTPEGLGNSNIFQKRLDNKQFYTYCEFNIKRESKLQFFLSLIDELPDGVLLINEKLSCINMNKKCKQIFKLEDENLATQLFLNLPNITLRNNDIRINSRFSSQVMSKVNSSQMNEGKVPSDDSNLKEINFRRKTLISMYPQLDDDNEEEKPRQFTKDFGKQLSLKNSAKSEKFMHSFKTAQCLDKPQISDIFRTNKIPLSDQKCVKDEVSQIFQSYSDNNNSEKKINQQIYSSDKVQIICHLGSNQKEKNKILQIFFIPCFFQNQNCIFCIIKNVTYIQRIDLLEKLNENKSKMLSQVAHEIRTPLNCIINMLDISSQCESIDQAQQYIQPSLKSAKLLSNLIHDLLDIAQQKAGTFQLSLSKFHFKGLLYEIKDLMNLQAISQGLKLIIDYNSSSQELIVSDQYRIRQIIINLLGNALKYTKEGSVTVIVSNYQNNQSILEVKIKDTGLGIKQENLSKLFQAFSKIESDKDKQLNPQGVGLGLMISNMLVKSLEPVNINRGLAVQSELGKGTEFSFLLFDHSQILHQDNEDSQQEIIKGKKKKSKDDQDNDDDDVEEDDDEDQDNHYDEQENGNSSEIHNYTKANTYQINTKLKDFQSMKNLDNQINSDFCPSEDNNRSLYSIQIKLKQCKCNKVLIVDDQQFNIITLQKMLGFYNIESDATLSGEDCEVICKKRLQQKCCNSYKIIFIDFDMPNQDGITTTKNLVKLFQSNNIEASSIIGCTGYSDQSSQQQGMKAGMKQIIQKPINSQDLKIIVNKYIYKTIK